MSSNTVPGGFPIIRKEPTTVKLFVTPKLGALGGLALFGCALLVVFRILALNASHELQQPGIDFAICVVIASLGLSVTRLSVGKDHKAISDQALVTIRKNPRTFGCGQLLQDQVVVNPVRGDRQHW